MDRILQTNSRYCHPLFYGSLAKIGRTFLVIAGSTEGTRLVVLGIIGGRLCSIKSTIDDVVAAQLCAYDTRLVA